MRTLYVSSRTLASALRLNAYASILVLSPLSVTALSAQSSSPGEWTWMGGSSTIGNDCVTSSPGEPYAQTTCGRAGVYGTLGTPAAGNIPGTRVSPTTWADSSGKLWLFGGEGWDVNGQPASLNDLWRFDPITNLWTWIGGSNTGGQAGVYGTLGTPSAGNIPGARFSAAAWTDSSGNFWMFGGGSAVDANGNSGYLNDLWEYNPSTNLWAWMGGNSTVDSTGGEVGAYGTLGAPAAGNIPGGRSSTATWTDKNGNFWLLGGQGLDADGHFVQFGDLWELDPSTLQWAWMGGNPVLHCGQQGCHQPSVYGSLGTPAAGNFPGTHVSTSTWTDKSGNFWMFGGDGGNDFWEFNPSTDLWAWMGGSGTINCAPSGCAVNGVYGTLGTPAAGNFPGAHYNASNWVDNSGNLWLFGGSGTDADGTNGELNDLWQFNPSTYQWTWMGGSSTIGSSCYNYYGSTICGQSGIYGTLGVAAGGNFPGSRDSSTGSAGSAAWTDQNGNFWLFGGNAIDANGANGYLNDLWKYQPPGTLVQPALTWATPAPITYGTALTAAQLDATTTVPGKFVYTPPAGTVLDAGSQTLSVTFTPTDTTAYTTATATVMLAVNGLVPPITWATPAAINYGQRLGAAQLDAKTKVAGSFTYSPALGTVLGAGTQTLSATFTPANTAVYAITIVTVPLVVNPEKLTVTANNLPMSYGAAVPALTYSVAGFVNGDTPATALTGTPALGTSATSASPVGAYAITAAQGTLAAANYTLVFDNGTLTINKAPLTVTATNLSMIFGSAVPPLTYSITGFVNGDTQASATTGAPTLATTAASSPTVANYPITVAIGSLSATDYSFTLRIGVLKVTKATPFINWPTPAPITFGTALSATQLDATSPVSGTFVYAPPAGTPGPGALILSTTFTPADLTDYNVVKASVTLTVNKAAQTITFAPPTSPVVYGILPINLVATSTSGLAVTFTVQSGPGKLAGSKLTITGAGTVVVAANQAGNGAYTAAPSVTQSIVVNKSTPSVGLISSTNAVAAGKPVTFKATLIGSGGAPPTGTITFLNGTTVFGTVAVNGAGVATFTTNGLPEGSDSITASYSGDINYSAVTSTAVSVIVD